MLPRPGVQSGPACRSGSRIPALHERAEEVGSGDGAGAGAEGRPDTVGVVRVRPGRPPDSPAR